jgi:hypothetical protein
MNEKISNKDKKEKMPEELPSWLKEAHLSRMPEELKQRMAALPPNVQATVFAAVQEYSSIVEKETYLLVLRIMSAKD